MAWWTSKPHVAFLRAALPKSGDFELWSTKNSTIGTAILEETRVGKKTCQCLSDWAEGPTSGQQCRREPSKWPERSTKSHVPRTCCLALSHLIDSAENVAAAREATSFEGNDFVMGNYSLKNNLNFKLMWAWSKQLQWNPMVSEW